MVLRNSGRVGRRQILKSPIQKWVGLFCVYELCFYRKGRKVFREVRKGIFLCVLTYLQ